MRRIRQTGTTMGRVWKGVVAGAAAGAVGACAMLVFGAVFDAAFDRAPGRNRPRKFLPTADQELDGTATLALMAARASGRDLRGKSLVKAARAAHFLFAAGLGAVYGALAEITPRVTAGRGMAFAAAEELSGNEWLMPRIGFLREHYPVSQHVHSLGSHLLWGATTEMVRKRLRSAA